MLDYDQNTDRDTLRGEVQQLDAAGFDRFVVDEELTANVAIQHGSTAFAIGDVCLKTEATEDISVTDGRVTGLSTLAKISEMIKLLL